MQPTHTRPRAQVSTAKIAGPLVWLEWLADEGIALDAAARLLLLTLVELAAIGLVQHSLQRLGALVGLSRSGAQHALERLVAVGLVRVEARSGEASVHTVLRGPLAETDDLDPPPSPAPTPPRNASTTPPGNASPHPPPPRLALVRALQKFSSQIWEEREEKKRAAEAARAHTRDAGPGLAKVTSAPAPLSAPLTRVAAAQIPSVLESALRERYGAEELANLAKALSRPEVRERPPEVALRALSTLLQRRNVRSAPALFLCIFRATETPVTALETAAAIALGEARSPPPRLRDAPQIPRNRPTQAIVDQYLAKLAEVEHAKNVASERAKAG